MKKIIIYALNLVFLFATCKQNIKNDTAPSVPQVKPKEVLQGFVAISLPESGVVGKNPSYKTPVGMANSEAWWKGVFVEGRTVKLSSYAIAESEVTYKLWKEVLDWAKGNGYTFIQEGFNGSENQGDEEQPVTNITWRDAVVWCNAYTQKEKGQDAECVYFDSKKTMNVIKNAREHKNFEHIYCELKKSGFRLPTEAEWELAARFQINGSEATNADDYSNGVFLTKLDSASGAMLACPFRGMNLPKGKTYEDLRDETSKVAIYNKWFNGTEFVQQSPAVSKTEKIKTKKANQLGLYDMSGNVFEWCFDIYNDNVKAGDGGKTVVENPIGLETRLDINRESRVVRGGSYFYDTMQCTVGYRFNAPSLPQIGNKPENIFKSQELGFRLAYTN